MIGFEQNVQLRIFLVPREVPLCFLLTDLTEEVTEPARILTVVLSGLREL